MDGEDGVEHDDQGNLARRTQQSMSTLCTGKRIKNSHMLKHYTLSFIVVIVYKMVVLNIP